MKNIKRFNLVFAFTFITAFTFAQEKKEVEKKPVPLQSKKTELPEKTNEKAEPVKSTEGNKEQLDEIKPSNQKTIENAPLQQPSSTLKQEQDKKDRKSEIKPTKQTAPKVVSKPVITEPSTPLPEKKSPPLK
jgi:hypothetical protein